MLWSPNEVLAYVKDDLSVPSTSVVKDPSHKVIPTDPFGGFETWPSEKEDFILVAENSEIHGPNPLFTIPQLSPDVDLNSLSTQILSADYQGLSNNKILPDKNALLLMPDISPDTHAAINYFFLFDSEARGFVRPTCLAYFTSDKHKLVSLAKDILDALSEVAAILQHSNITCHVDELRSLRDKLKASLSNVTDAGLEAKLKDIQDILNIVDNYQGNKLFDKHICNVMKYFKNNAASERIRNLDSILLPKVTTVSPTRSSVFRPNARKCMKSLYHICHCGTVLGLYHLYIMHKYFRRKYENIANSVMFPSQTANVLLFGACIVTSQNSFSFPSHQNKCLLSMFKIPSTLSLENSAYFECLDSQFENILLSFFDGIKNEFKSSDQPSTWCNSSQEFSDSSDYQSCSSQSSGFLSAEMDIKEDECRHFVTSEKIWDTIEHIKSEHPGLESSLLQVLRLFDDTKRLLFAVFTRTPILVISTPQQKLVAQNFVKALSVFIPRKRDELLMVDPLRQDSLEKEQFSKYAILHFCLANSKIEELVPLEFLPTACILNLKDCSFSAATYTGTLLADVDRQVRAVPASGPIFPILVSILLDIDRTLRWWDVVSSSAADMTTATQYVLSKGFNHLDMQIIQKLSRLSRK